MAIKVFDRLTAVSTTVTTRTKTDAGKQPSVPVAARSVPPEIANFLLKFGFSIPDHITASAERFDADDVSQHLIERGASITERLQVKSLLRQIGLL